MPRKKQNTDKNVDIKTGDISNSNGQVNIAGGNIITNQNIEKLDSKEIQRLFDELYSYIELRADLTLLDKKGIKVEVEEIQEAVVETIEQKNKLSESFFMRRFRNISRIAPDILDVVVTTLTNPLLGLGLVAKKIALMAQENP